MRERERVEKSRKEVDRIRNKGRVYKKVRAYKREGACKKKGRAINVIKGE